MQRNVANIFENISGNIFGILFQNLETKKNNIPELSYTIWTKMWDSNVEIFLIPKKIILLTHVDLISSGKFI